MNQIAAWLLKLWYLQKETKMRELWEKYPLTALSSPMAPCNLIIRSDLNWIQEYIGIFGLIIKMSSADCFSDTIQQLIRLIWFDHISCCPDSECKINYLFKACGGAHDYWNIRVKLF